MIEFLPSACGYLPLMKQDSLEKTHLNKTAIICKDSRVESVSVALIMGATSTAQGDNLVFFMSEGASVLAQSEFEKIEGKS